MKKIWPFIVCLCWGSTSLLGQKTNNQDTHTYKIFRTSESIKVDGELNEVVWQNTAKVGPFWYSFPVDDKAVEDEHQTEVMLTYDDKNIYIAAICHGKGPLVIPSLKRENNEFWNGDVFSVVFDAVNERTNAAGFGTNPAGVQHETLIGANTGTRGGGGSGGFNTAWDNKWLTNSKQYADRWTTEMAIPFKTLKYGNKTIWGMNFVRGVSKTNSWHTWAPVPVQLTGVDLGFTGALIWDDVPPKAKSNISVIPYVLGSTFKDFEEGEPQDNDFRIGGDAKIAVNSNLNLDVTINPDFSQVDVDVQVTNLTTVNIRFPERRLFFLENRDVFTQFGIPPMRPFFSRRIGLDDDGNAIPILYGARLTGNVNKDLRIGVMNLQTKETDETYGQNYTSVAFNQRLFGRTIAKGFFQNRQAYTDGEFSTNDYNRALGGELEYRSLNGALLANAGFGLSLSDGISDKNSTYHAIFSYSDRNISFYTNYMAVGDNYIPEMGFFTLLYHYDAITETEHRIGYGHNFSRFTYTFYPENKKINSHRLGVRAVFDLTTTGNDLFLARWVGSYDLNFANTSSIEIDIEKNDRELFFPFGFTDDDPLPAGEYNWSFISASFESDQRKAFSHGHRDRDPVFREHARHAAFAANKTHRHLQNLAPTAIGRHIPFNSLAPPALRLVLTASITHLSDTRKGQPSPGTSCSLCSGADPAFRSELPLDPAVPGFAVSPSVSWRIQFDTGSAMPPGSLRALADSRPGQTQRARNYTAKTPANKPSGAKNRGFSAG